MPLSPFLDIEVPVTFKDHPDVQSALFYTPIHLCNLECYKCHNKLLFSGEEKFLSYEKLEEKLMQLKLLGVELIIVSGGEPTLAKGLFEGLEFIRRAGFFVRSDTNGMFPEVVKELIDLKLVNGFAVDIKIPLKGSYTQEEVIRFGKILFSEEVSEEKIAFYSQQVQKTVEILKQISIDNNNYYQYNLLRTVRYPLLSLEDLRDIKNFVGKSGIFHQVNPFYNPEE